MLGKLFTTITEILNKIICYIFTNYFIFFNIAINWILLLSKIVSIVWAVVAIKVVGVQ